MRPLKLDDFFGQEHLIGPNKPLRYNLEAGLMPSLILWGPPGIGKTTLAGIIAEMMKRTFFQLSAVHSGVKEVREILDTAKRLRTPGKPGPVLFIDEIHRFSKSQQDALLGAVEKGTVQLIGATTENPSFEVNSALLSRCEILKLEPLSADDLKKVASRALETDDRMRGLNVVVEEWDALLSVSGGDARKLLNIMEIAALSGEGNPRILNNANVMLSAGDMGRRYDKSGEMHYDLISAFIKSVRGSDPNASLYYLARILVGGEKPEFIARRLLVLASEDIGLANPTALVLANACFQSVHVIGLPESDLILAETTLYLATSPKSNSTYKAIRKAQQLVRETGDLEVPLHLRNAVTGWMESWGYGKGYEYPHDFPGNFKEAEYLPREIAGHNLYHSAANARENEIKTFLEKRWRDKYEF